ncbi:GNAT family N-acetyltransferase [Ruegeria sp. 2012CJ41-6]|uniref:GNAT family N-acetyltransferase n=1 Tax=Ruegeria spongiae TaxID=2942209 RepID=A0ABT0Q847_9RHOB|nr:GNAT family N-acetyltransferase [Ruegeria spongiae]MCL6286056.1 GNAT family N-acetyltransferase [Ruegeria spongiae]
MHIEALSGQKLVDSLEDLARLRIEVFRDWPYLYDGDLDYEHEYLKSYAESASAILVGAFDGDRLVGGSTGMALLEHSDDFSAAFEGTDLDLSQIFYCAESVLLPQYRGQGIGHQFFDLREEYARGSGYAKSAFCGVVRPADHPARPAHYRALDGFWTKRGYHKLPGVIAQFSWKDLGDDAESQKNLQFWIRDL